VAEGGVAAGAALKGIDRAFESYERSRRGGKAAEESGVLHGSVLEAAEESRRRLQGAEVEWRGRRKKAFSREDVRAYLERNIKLLRKAVEQVRRIATGGGDLIAQALIPCFGG